MGKTIEKVLAIIRESDVILEVLDSRYPRFSKRLEGLSKKKGRELVFIFNKSDLVKKTKDLRELAKDYNGIVFSAVTRRGKRELIGRLHAIASRKKKEIRVSVVGLPNTGKSRLINVLKGRKAAGVSPNPGYTRGKQWVRLSKDIILIDSPGVITWDEPEEELIIRDSLSIDKTSDPVPSATLLFEQESWVLDSLGLKLKGEAALEEFARRTGKLLKGGEPNIKEAARMIIRRFQKGEIRR